MARKTARKLLSMVPAAAAIERAASVGSAVLVYHRPSINVLHDHVARLRMFFQIEPLSTLYDALAAGGSPAPGRAYITLDDGWRENYELMPIFEEVPATIFVCAGLVGTHRRLWNDIAKASSMDLNEQLKLDEPAVRNAKLRDVCGGVDGQTEFRDRAMLSWDELERLKRVVDIQAHSMTHPVLSTCSDMDLHTEVGAPRRVIAEKLGSEVRYFAYPYGRGKYGPREVRKCRSAGYSGARSACFPRFVTAGVESFEVPGINVPDEATVNQLDAALRYAAVRTLLKI